MSGKFQDCPRCQNSARLEKRPFSDQALAALVIWGELDRRLIEQAICDDCYNDLRDVLIERSEDIKQIKPKDYIRAS